MTHTTSKVWLFLYSDANKRLEDLPVAVEMHMEPEQQRWEKEKNVLAQWAY